MGFLRQSRKNMKRAALEENSVELAGKASLGLDFVPSTFEGKGRHEFLNKKNLQEFCSCLK